MAVDTHAPAPVELVDSPIRLNCEELELIRAFRAMDRYEKDHALDQAQWAAAKYPDKPAPRLHLVGGGAS
jgi:hypothetical protein